MIPQHSPLSLNQLENDMSMPNDLAKMLSILREARTSLDDPADLSVLLVRIHEMCSKKLTGPDNLRRVMDSQDLGQNVLLQLVQAAHLFKGDTWPQFWSFASKIVDNQLVSAARTHRSKKRDMDRIRANQPDDATVTRREPGPFSIEANADDKKKMLKLVGELREPYKSALEERLAGNDYSVIGKNEGISEEAARKRVSRALALIKEQW